MRAEPPRALPRPSHKPDENLHKLGSDSPQARLESPQAGERFSTSPISPVHPPATLRPEDFFVCPYRLFRLPTRLFGSRETSVQRRRHLAQAKCAAPANSIPVDSRRLLSTPVDSAPRARTPAASMRPPRGGFIETALPSHHAAVPSKPPYRATAAVSSKPPYPANLSIRRSNWLSPT